MTEDFDPITRNAVRFIDQEVVTLRKPYDELMGELDRLWVVAEAAEGHVCNTYGGKPCSLRNALDALHQVP